jgi:hypothetical protein
MICILISPSVFPGVEKLSAHGEQHNVAGGPQVERIEMALVLSQPIGHLEATEVLAEDPRLATD